MASSHSGVRRGANATGARRTEGKKKSGRLLKRFRLAEFPIKPITRLYVTRVASGRFNCALMEAFFGGAANRSSWGIFLGRSLFIATRFARSDSLRSSNKRSFLSPLITLFRNKRISCELETRDDQKVAYLDRSGSSFDSEDAWSHVGGLKKETFKENCIGWRRRLAQRSCNILKVKYGLRIE